MDEKYQLEEMSFDAPVFISYETDVVLIFSCRFWIICLYSWKKLLDTMDTTRSKYNWFTLILYEIKKILTDSNSDC